MSSIRISSPLVGADQESKTAMIVLNTPISNPPSEVFTQLWKNSQYHVCADGGANRLHDATVGTSDFIPDIIVGDLDSLRDNVRDYYATHSVPIQRNPDQDNNDLDKSMQKIIAYDKDDLDQVVVYGAFGGRLDQEMASFQALYKWAPQFSNRLWLYNEETCAILLPAQQTVELGLDCCNTSLSVREGPTCGLIPLASKCDSITTTGFKWNLNQDTMEFGGLVSTSNEVEGTSQESGETTISVATVLASHPILFTAEILQEAT